MILLISILTVANSRPQAKLPSALWIHPAYAHNSASSSSCGSSSCLEGALCAFHLGLGVLLFQSSVQVWAAPRNPRSVSWARGVHCFALCLLTDCPSQLHGSRLCHPVYAQTGLCSQADASPGMLWERWWVKPVLFCFETEFLCVVLPVLEFALWTRLTSNSQNYIARACLKKIKESIHPLFY